MKPDKKYKITVPRNSLRRFIVRVIGRIVLPVVLKIRIEGRENFPKDGPVILIGNHSAVMEPVMMAVFSPRQVEFIGSVDIPHEPSSKMAMDFYQMIPVFRGKPERSSLKQALEVLQQKGCLAIFPEGGVWSPGKMQAKTGVSFLSHRGYSPVVPIAFIGAEGALNAMFQFKRPEITMKIGKPIPPLADSKINGEVKVGYENYAEHVMQQVYALLPEEVLSQINDVQNEKFHLEVDILDSDGNLLPLPLGMDLKNAESLAMLLHRPGILKIFRINLEFPVEPLQQLHTHPGLDEIQNALQPMISYLEDETNGNPYLLTYRFGPETGKAMLAGLKELLSLVEYCMNHDLTLHLQPVRQFYSQIQGMEIIQIEQGVFDHWR